MTAIRRPVVLLLLPLLLMVAVAGAGQAPTSKVDTTTADTVVVGASSPADAPVDSSSLSGAGESTEAVLTDSVILRTVPDTAVEAWQKDRHFAYANDPAYWRPQRPVSSPFLLWLGRVLGSAGFRYFVYFVLGGLLVFAILRIMFENNLGLFYRSRAKKKRSGGGDVTDGADLAAEDLDERLRYYLGRNDHRHSVRYLYLRSLRGLGGRGLIKGGGEFTNREYLRQLAGTPQEAAFRFLTSAYEKVWYGDFQLGDDAFRRLHQYFEDFDKTVAI